MKTPKIETILARIQEIRKQRGYSLENMADELDISHSAYYKLENNQSRLTVERLLNQNNNVKDSTIIAKQEFEHYYEKDRETTARLLNLLESENKHLKSEIDFLRGILKKESVK